MDKQLIFEPIYSQKDILLWMCKELSENESRYLDCGEVNTTLLAENAADHFNLYLDDTEYGIDDSVFGLSLIAEKLYKGKHGYFS